MRGQVSDLGASCAVAASTHRRASRRHRAPEVRGAPIRRRHCGTVRSIGALPEHARADVDDRRLARRDAVERLVGRDDQLVAAPDTGARAAGTGSAWARICTSQSNGPWHPAGAAPAHENFGAGDLGDVERLFRADDDGVVFGRTSSTKRGCPSAGREADVEALALADREGVRALVAADHGARAVEDLALLARRRARRASRGCRRRG